MVDFEAYEVEVVGSSALLCMQYNVLLYSPLYIMYNTIIVLCEYNLHV